MLLHYFGRRYLDTDGQSYAGYDPRIIDAVLAEAAHLFRHLGFAAQHTTLIGGVVPSLLVLDPPHTPHVGTTDLDLCLSLAIIEGDTEEYDRIEDSLKKAGYEPTDVSFRWKQRDQLRLVVEFFCPSGEDRPAGRIYRPKQADNPRAKQNLGSNLSTYALDVGGILTEDVISVQREAILPNDEGRINFTFRVTGVLGFLIAKTGALLGRDKPKDAYDIVWILENWDGGPTVAASVVASSPAYLRDDVRLMLDRMFDTFESTDKLGPSSFARFMAEQDMTRDDRLRLQRQAVGAVGEFRRTLQN